MEPEFAFRCAKLEGCGNSFVVLVTPPGPLADWAGFARRACNPRTGFGADGVLVIRPERSGRWPVDLWNPDGTPMGMCGNGVRCIARFLVDEGLALAADPVVLEVAGRGIVCHLLPDRRIRVDMGVPTFRPEEVPHTCPGELLDHELWVDGELLRVSVLSMGNPHCVIFSKSGSDLCLATWGPRLENHPLFPERANISFASVERRDRVALRVWERGAGATLACGTAASATVVAGVRLGHLDRRVEVALPGGVLEVEWSESSGSVVLTGPAERVEGGYLSFSSLRMAHSEVQWSAPQ